MAKEKIVLAYSGGLDTSIIIPWLKEHYDCEVIAVAADVGQGEELEPLHEKAIKTGASKLYIADLREEFITQYIWPTLKAGAMYENTYLLGTSMARPPIAKALVDIAHKEGAKAIAHGATGKGNDQVRFELTIKALDPSIKIIAPWRLWDIKSREEEIEYAAARGIDVPVTKERPYSMDRNIWHISHEGADLEDPWNAPKDDLYMITKSPKAAPDESEVIEIEFEKGIPVAVNGEKLGPIELIEKCNEIGAKYGIGIDDMIENRLVGMKSRGVYENPAGTILYTALKQLEMICLDRDTLHYKHQVAIRYSELVYNGQWFAPLREGLDAFMDSIQQNTTGVSRLTLYKGRCYNAGVKSPYSLYNPEFATFGEDAVYNQKDAEGFINLFGLPMTVAALMKESLKK